MADSKDRQITDDRWQITDDRWQILGGATPKVCVDKLAISTYDLKDIQLMLYFPLFVF